MTKRKSFFERITGNLKLDELDEEIIVEEERKVTLTPMQIEERESPAYMEAEVGELAIDMYESPKDITVQTFIAGVQSDQVNITITRDTITISGKREENRLLAKETPHIRELYWGAFERIVELPEEVDVDQAEAVEKHGMLIIKMPKIDKGRKNTLKVKAI